MNGHPPTNAIFPAAPAAKASFDDHPCLSADASCSGLAPCEPCRVALSTWVMPKALLAASCATEDQVTRFLDTYGQARTALIASIREAAIAHEAMVARTRAAFDSVAPASVSVPAAPVSEAAIAIAAQIEPLKKASKKTKAAAVAEAGPTLDEIFGAAVKPAASVPDPVPDPVPTTTSDKKKREKQ